MATYITFENLLVVATQDYLAREKAKKDAQEGKNLGILDKMPNKAIRSTPTLCRTLA